MSDAIGASMVACLRVEWAEGEGFGRQSVKGQCRQHEVELGWQLRIGRRCGLLESMANRGK